MLTSLLAALDTLQSSDGVWKQHLEKRKMTQTLSEQSYHNPRRIGYYLHPPNDLLQYYLEYEAWYTTTIFQSSNISPMIHLTLEQRLYDLEASLGICNRILMSPIPPTYTWHTSRVLCLFLFLLPLNFAGSKMSPSALLLGVTTITYVLVGIDEIGLEIEHPFPVLPMQQMATTFQKNVVRISFYCWGGYRLILLCDLTSYFSGMCMQQKFVWMRCCVDSIQYWALCLFMSCSRYLTNTS